MFRGDMSSHSQPTLVTGHRRDYSTLCSA